MPLLLLPVLWMLAELLVIIVVAGGIGALATIAWLVLAVVAGVWLIRGEQLALLAQAAAARDASSARMRESGFRVFAGILLIVPGFLSDALALALLLPPVRLLLGALLLKLFAPLMDRMAVRTYHRGQTFEHEAANDSDNTGDVIHGELLERKRDE